MAVMPLRPPLASARHGGARLTLALTALGYIGAAVSLRPPYPFANLVAVCPWLWQALFSFAAFNCAALAVAPHLRSLRYATLLTMTAATGSRAVALTFLADAYPAAVAWAMATLWQVYAWRLLIVEMRTVEAEGRSWPSADRPVSPG
jgi:hypothetical protein